MTDNTSQLTMLLCSGICLAPLAAGFMLGWFIRSRTIGQGLIGLLPEFIQRLLEREE